MSEGETLFADAYGMTARHRAEFAPFAVDMARRYHEDSRACAELDPVYRKLWEDGAQVYLPRAETWRREGLRRSPAAWPGRASWQAQKYGEVLPMESGGSRS